jgi:hypothetical protein
MKPQILLQVLIDIIIFTYPRLVFHKSGSWNSKEWRGNRIIATDDGYNLLWTKGNINPFGIWHRGTDDFISTLIIDWRHYAP